MYNISRSTFIYSRINAKLSMCCLFAILYCISASLWSAFINDDSRQMKYFKCDTKRAGPGKWEKECYVIDKRVVCMLFFSALYVCVCVCVLCPIVFVQSYLYEISRWCCRHQFSFCWCLVIDFIFMFACGAHTWLLCIDLHHRRNIKPRVNQFNAW